ncbi:MAG: two-component system OmpR family alkaline phosphatase synthesis response regulator PhoP [Fusobacteria bacterium]|nr:MAG: two-component system OmpR family alkaline phosphatase synthesis response regulator PhoP [Fusobacteriota bacterium]KAF0230057.1 MAG: two-component system OmpR family alkaline phosphatase synthesis response regulator [Fusobacteriota bacterium]
MSKELIYVVDDEENIRELIEYNLKKAGYIVKCFADGTSFLETLQDSIPDLVCLDVMLPDYDGLDLCKKIRTSKRLKSLPIILLTAKTTEFDTIIGLESGADDYIGKPFSVNELIARIRSLLRRTIAAPIEKSDVAIGNLIIDIEKRTVTINEKLVELTLKEFELLNLLANGNGKVFTRNELLEKIWGYDYYGDTRTVDVHIHSLRKIIGDEYILTVRGVGYKFIS